MTTSKLKRKDLIKAAQMKAVLRELDFMKRAIVFALQGGDLTKPMPMEKLKEATESGVALNLDYEKDTNTFLFKLEEVG